MQRFGEGDFNVICAVRANDEIGELSQHFNMMVYNINDLVDRVYNANMLRQKAELEALRMQINPHFLYNTLDMVAWISRDKGVTEVADIAVSLSQMMRYTIKGTAMTDLKAELEHILTRWEESSCSLILRFLYDWDGNAQSTEPNDISQIEKRGKWAECSGDCPYSGWVHGNSPAFSFRRIF